MALFGSVSPDYTKTGKGFFDRASDTLSYIPLIGGALAWPVGMIGTIIDTGKWIFQGKFGSALTVLAAGTVGNSVNAITSGSGPLGGIIGKGIAWWGNAASGVATGATLGDHARALTESLIGGVGGALGQKPTVLSSYPAAIGSIGNSVDYSGKDNFRDKIAAERGMTREQMDARADQAYVNMASGSNQLGA